MRDEGVGVEPSDHQPTQSPKPFSRFWMADGSLRMAHLMLNWRVDLALEFIFNHGVHRDTELVNQILHR